MRVKPLRCYLKYKNGEEDYAGARRRAIASIELPETISVRLVSATGEVTAIGALSTQTGIVSFDPEAWYSLSGVRLAGKPTVRGLYINNGKKVMIK